MAAGRASICVADFLVDLMVTKTRAHTAPLRDTPGTGQALPSRHGQREPRLPHEHDESSDSQTGIQDERIVQAARDLANGQQDTGRTPVVTELARKEFGSRAAAARDS